MGGVIEAFREALSLAPRAICGGTLAAAASGGIGVVLRWRRLVWTGFAVPEAATVGAALALGADTLLPALGVSGALPPVLLDQGTMSLVTAAFAIAWLLPVARSARPGGERAAAACFLVAATLTVLLVSESPHGTEEVRALATGKTLLFLEAKDVALLTWWMPPLVVLAFLFARPLAALAFDRDHARAAGHRVVRLEAGFAAGFLALVAVAAPRAGAPFVFAYLTLPAAAAERLVARPGATVVVATLLATLGFLVGATASVRFDLPFSTAAAGGALSVAGGSVFLAIAWRAIRRFWTNERP